MYITLVESPYRCANVKAAREVAIRYALWALYDSCEIRGELGFASHLLYTQIWPETLDCLRKGLERRNYLARRCANKIARYIDCGLTAGMVGPEDQYLQIPVEDRKLPAQLLQAFEAGSYPNGSVRLAVL